jgi:hypothetical protein
MAEDMNEVLQSLLKDTTTFAGTELQTFIAEAKNDMNPFIKRIGALTESNLLLRAQRKITDDELKELMEDILDLNKMEYHHLSSDAKVRAQRIVNGVSDLVVKHLSTLII